MYRDIADECILEKPMNWNGYENRDLLKDAYQSADALHGRTTLTFSANKVYARSRFTPWSSTPMGT